MREIYRISLTVLITLVILAVVVYLNWPMSQAQYNKEYYALQMEELQYMKNMSADQVSRDDVTKNGEKMLKCMDKRKALERKYPVLATQYYLSPECLQFLDALGALVQERLGARKNRSTHTVRPGEI